MGLIVAIGVATPAMAADVSVTLTGVKAKGGTVMVSLYDEATFLRAEPPFMATVTGGPANVTVTFKNVPAGDYAVAAFHDADDDHQMDMGPDGRMTEGTAMSNADKLRAAPTFATTKLTIPAAGAQLTLPMSYPEDRKGW